MLLTSESWARLSIPCSQGGLPYQVVEGGLATKFDPEIRVRARAKFCHQTYRREVSQTLPFEFQI